MTDEEILLACVEEYADPSNYEVYEKDMGFGPQDTMPAFASNKGSYARNVLAYLKLRKQVLMAEKVDAQDLKS